MPEDNLTALAFLVTVVCEEGVADPGLELVEPEDVEELGAVLVDEPVEVVLSDPPQPDNAAIIAHNVICPKTDFCISLSRE